MNQYTFSIGEIVKAIRLNKGFSQVTFCESLQNYARIHNLRSTIVQSTISKIENNTFEEVSFSTIDLISRMCDVPLSDFQIGYLTNKNIDYNNLVKTRYGALPQFSSLFIFKLFSKLQIKSNLSEKDFYKSLMFPKEVMAFKHARFDVSILQKAYQLYPAEFSQIISEYEFSSTDQFTKTILPEQLEKTYPGFKFETIENKNQMALTVQIDKKKTKRLKLAEDDLLNCLALDLKTGLNKFKSSIVHETNKTFLQITC